MSATERKRTRGRPRSLDAASSVCVALWLVLLSTLSADAQIFGTTVCICSPSAYRMTLGFSQTCDATTIEGDGIVTTDCAIAPFQDDSVTDLVPVTVGSIDILELDEDLTLLTQSSIFGTYNDGDSFEYTSISSDASMVNSTMFPKALQVSVLGNNANGDSIFFAGLIIFRTDCSTYPVLDVGDSIGWVTFTALTDPLQAVCPIVTTRPPSETMAPVAPTPSPLVRPPISMPSPPSDSSSGDPPVMPSRSTKRPSPAPTAPNPKPSCGSSKGKGKGKKKSKKKGVRGKGKGSSKSYSYSKDIFYHDECDSSKGKGKGKGKGNKHTSSSKGSKSKSSGKGYHYPIHPDMGDSTPPSPSPTRGSVTIDDSTSVDQSSIDQPEAFFSDGKRNFWGSSAYYSFLLIVTAAALVGAVYVWRRPGKRQKMERERLIALQKGLEWSERQ